MISTLWSYLKVPKCQGCGGFQWILHTRHGFGGSTRQGLLLERVTPQILQKTAPMVEASRKLDEAWCTVYVYYVILSPITNPPKY